MKRSILALVLVGAACGTPPPVNDGTPDGGTTASGTPDGGSTTTGAGLPCDVAKVLQTYCLSCHGQVPAGGAPMSLATYADLAKTSPIGGMSYAQRALVRMQATTAPMPPAPATRVAAADITTFATWVNGGAPAGTCGGGMTPPDPLNAAPTCTSGQTWFGEDGSNMNPGQACITCHAQRGREAPLFSIAGTVYPTGHEPDNCYGAAGALVVITDASGNTLQLTAGPTGNFSSRATVALPFRAKVSYQGKERVMNTPQMSGDCNSCHTQNGASGAPGRITLP